MEVDISSIRYEVGASLQVVVSEEWPPFNWSGEEIRFSQPVMVELELTNTGELFLAQGQIKTLLLVACSRCLELFDLALETPFLMGYTEQQEMDSVLPDDDLEVRLFKGDIINMTSDVKETLRLALPMKALCNQDCRGLCPQCGQNLNRGTCSCEQKQVDPRLAVLRDFIKN